MKKSQRKKMSTILTEEEFNNKISEYTEKRTNRSKKKNINVLYPQNNEIDLSNNISRVNDNIMNNNENKNNYNSFSRNMNERIKNIKNKQKAASADNNNKKSYFIEDRENLK